MARPAPNWHMSDLTMKLEGFEELEKSLKEVPQALKYDIVMDTLVKAGKIVVAERNTAPKSKRKKFLKERRHFTKSKGQHKITTKHGAGELRRSFGIVKSKKSKTPLIWAGPRQGYTNFDAYWAGWVEFGTEKQKAQGYIKKIFDRTEGRVTAAIQNGVFDIIDKHLTKHGWTGKL